MGRSFHICKYFSVIVDVLVFRAGRLGWLDLLPPPAHLPLSLPPPPSELPAGNPVNRRPWPVVRSTWAVAGSACMMAESAACWQFLANSGGERCWGGWSLVEAAVAVVSSAGVFFATSCDNSAWQPLALLRFSMS